MVLVGESFGVRLVERRGFTGENVDCMQLKLGGVVPEGRPLMSFMRRVVSSVTRQLSQNATWF